MSDIANIIGERLRLLRTQAGYSQEALAERAGLHYTYIGQLERGEKNATLESVEKIARALNVSFETLFAGVINMENRSEFATSCYHLVLSQPLSQQEMLYEILKSVIEYRQAQ